MARYSTIEGATFTEQVQAESWTRYINCTFQEGAGLELRDNRNVSVEGCTFKDTLYSGIRLQDPGDGQNKRIYVARNTFSNINTSNQHGHAAVQFHGGAIANNKHRFVWVEDNIMTGGWVGVGVDAGQNVWVTGNYYRGAVRPVQGGEGIACSGKTVTIEGNHIENTVGAGILLWYDTNTGGDFKVSNNVSINGAQGVALVWGDNTAVIGDCSITDNTCYGNQAGVQSYQEGWGTPDQVTADTYSSCHIVGNQLADNEVEVSLVNAEHPGLEYA